MAETVEYNLNLDLTLHPIQSILIKQYSKNVYKLIVSVTKESVVYVLSDSLYNVYFKMRTPDNRYVYTQGSIDENGRILLDVPESAAWTAGIGEAEFEIIKKDKSSRMSTCTFEVVIDASSYEEAEITGSEDFSALVDYISQAADISDEVAQAKEYRDEAVTSATTASQAAQTATTAESLVRGLQESAAASATVAVESKESAEASATTASQAAQSASEDAEATSQALQEAIALYNGPLTAKTAAEMTQTNRIYVYTGSESGYTFGDWYYYNGSTWQSGGTYNATAMDLDDTLTVEGKAADAKAVGDEIESFRSYSTNKFSNLEMTDDSIREDVTSLKADLNRTEDEIIRTAGVIEELECGLTEEVKTALLACFTRVAWIGDDGQTYYDALSDALNRSRVISGISAVFTQGSAVIYDTDELYALKQYLTVTATYSDGTTKEVNNYTLIGKLVAGTSTITVAYNKKTTTFNVTVTHQTKTLESISATFNSSASITTDNVLDDLRPYLTVLATYADSTTSTITNYSLSGNLNVGTNTITVSYGGKTTTFTVNVTQAEATLQSISAVFNQGSVVIYENSSLESLKPYLTVTARYSDGTTQTVTNYTLSGTLTKGTSTITVSYSGKTATFKVVVTERATLQSITATFTQGSTVIYTDSSLDDLKPHLVVTANYSDATTATVTNYTLSGTLATGISTITVSYGGKTTTFNVTVSERPTLQSITATFTQGSAIIYENSSLNDLKQYLVVTATYSDSTTQTVTDYTLSGTLTAGTSTITVSYGGKTDTFNVTVSEVSADPIYALPEATTFNGTSNYIDTGLQLLTTNKTNLTIVFDGFATSLGGSQVTLLHCMHESSPWPGLTMYTNKQQFNADLNASGSAGHVAITNIVSSGVTEARIKCVWIIDFASMKSRVFLSVNDTLFNGATTIPSAMLDVNLTENALIGCYQKTDGTKGRFWKGTMYDYKIYNYAWTENAANAYLQEDHS